LDNEIIVRVIDNAAHHQELRAEEEFDSDALINTRKLIRK